MLTSRLTLTLLFLAIASSSASDIHRRHHPNRLIKKRSPFPQGAPLPPIIGAEAGPTGSSSPQAATSTTPTATPTSTTPAQAPTSSQPPVTSANTSPTTSAASSPTTSASSSPTVVTSAPKAPTANPSGLNLPTASLGTEIPTEVFATSTGVAASSTAPATPSDSSTKHTTVTVLIVIAAAIGCVAVIWTIIRKWKFRPSSDFENRMQPIDWQPTNPEDDGVPGHRRMGSNASSFLSGSHDPVVDNMAGRGVGGGGYGASDIAPSMAPIPDHDFTAGAASLAPVGGYADLARGPSPQPQMQEAITRGPSLHHQPQYDVYGAPIQHQAYAQDAYDYNGRGY